jgi:hypothetical protein
MFPLSFRAVQSGQREPYSLKQRQLPQTDARKQSRIQDILVWGRGKLEILAVRDGLTAGWQFTVFALTALALFSRSPNYLTHAQFYAEDGKIWFAQAYNGRWLNSLIVPQAGYLNTMPRLGAGLALLVPLQWAPLVMAIVGLLIQSVPVPILLSRRLRSWGSLPVRMFLAGIYVVIPNASEIHIVVTNTQWHLALIAALVAFAASPQTWVGRLVDCVLLLVSALSGPYCIFLAPLLLIFWWIRRQRWHLAMFGLISMGATTQIAAILQSTHRVRRPLGATPATFLRLLGGNVIASALFGSYAFARLAPMLFIVAAALLGLCTYLYCLRFASLEWRLFLVYCAALFAASLRSPLTQPGAPAWDVLIDLNSGRYWFFPMLAFVWSAVWCALVGPDRLFRIAGACVLLTMSVGILRDWRFAAYPNPSFATSVERLHDARPGDRVVMPIVPPGWSMELVKKDP